jgi:hypothetical protein
MDNDTNGIARLAIRIFSIIANSGATECNFSDFGNIQTKKRSRLSVEKTHKINLVRMEIRRRHASQGLLTTRSKRKLGNDNNPGSTIEDSSESDAEEDNFENLAQDLIDLAANDEAANEAEEQSAPRSIIAPLNQQRARHPSRTQMPLAMLFDFNRSDNGLDFYWTGAVKNLDAEAEACELAFAQQEGLQVPNMTDTSSIASTSSSLACA